MKQNFKIPIKVANMTSDIKDVNQNKSNPVDDVTIGIQPRSLDTI